MTDTLSTRLDEFRDRARQRAAKLRESLPPLPPPLPGTPLAEIAPAEPKPPTQFQQLAAAVLECSRALDDAIELFEAPIRAAMAAVPSDDALTELIRIRDELSAVRVFAANRNLSAEWLPSIANRIQQWRLDGFYSASEPAFRNVDFLHITRIDSNERRYGTGCDVATVAFEALARSDNVAHRRLFDFLASAMPERSKADVVVLPSDFGLSGFEYGSKKPRTVNGAVILKDCCLAASFLELLNRP